MKHGDVLAGITAALSVGSNADVVAVEARKAAQQRGDNSLEPVAPVRREQVVSLTERRLAELPSDKRLLPSVAAYASCSSYGRMRRPGLAPRCEVHPRRRLPASEAG